MWTAPETLESGILAFGSSHIKYFLQMLENAGLVDIDMSVCGPDGYDSSYDYDDEEDEETSFDEDDF